MLNLGCGRLVMPHAKPDHHSLMPDHLYNYLEWVNVDRNPYEGVCQIDLFDEKWDLPSNAFAGAMISHLCEHIPHATKSGMQDGWFAFFSELWRVLEHGAMVYILSPYGWSDDGISDPSHTRLLNEYHFRHSMQPNPDAPFDYNRNLHFEILEESKFRPMPHFAREPYFIDGEATDAFWEAKHTRINVIRDFLVMMRAIKE